MADNFYAMKTTGSVYSVTYLDVDVMLRCFYQVDVCIMNGCLNMVDTSRPVTRTPQNLQNTTELINITTLTL